jgi:hypothetical protein
MRFCRTLWLVGSMAAFLFSAAFADCPDATREASGSTTSERKQQPPVADRSVLLSLILSDSGKVRHAKVLLGHPTLVSAAINAAKKLRYNTANGYAVPHTREIVVSVTFDNNQQPKIRPASFGGVPGCVYAGQPIKVVPIGPTALPPLLNDFLHQQPAIPTLISETKK